MKVSGRKKEEENEEVEQEVRICELGIGASRR